MKSISTLEIPFCNITKIEKIRKGEFLSSLRAAISFPIPDIVTNMKIHYQEDLTDHFVVIDFDRSLDFALDFLNKKMQKSQKDRDC